MTYYLEYFDTPTGAWREWGFSDSNFEIIWKEIKRIRDSVPADVKVRVSSKHYAR